MQRLARMMAVCLVLSALGAGDALAGPIARERLDLTVYGEDLGLVRDVRRVRIEPGAHELSFTGIAARVIPQSVQVRFPAASGARVREQRYEYDLLSPAKLLEKYVGREVTLVSRDPQTGRDEEVRARVLSVNGGTVFEIGGAVTFDPPGRIVFPSVPDDLRASPTLIFGVDGAAKASDLQIDVAYLTEGLSWSADYVLTLAADGGRAALAGWATVRNESGASYPEAALALVAGEGGRVRDNYAARDVMMKGAAMEMAAAPAPDFAEEGFAEYHLYKLGRPVTLREGATQRLGLFDEAGLAVRTVYRIGGMAEMREWEAGEGPRKEAVGAFVEFRNAGEGLGMPLPGGVVRVYARDKAGSLRFAGEDRIAHTPRDEEVRLRLGAAFDLTAERRQTGWAHPRQNTYESAEELTIRNHRGEDVTVEVREGMAGEWRIMDSSHPFEKADSRTALFKVKVPAGKTAVLTYRVRSDF